MRFSERRLLFSSFLRDLVVLLPGLLVDPAPAVVVGGGAVQLVVFPDSDPLVAVAEVEDAIPVLEVVEEVSRVSESFNVNISISLRRREKSPVSIRPDVLSPSLSRSFLGEFSLVYPALGCDGCSLGASVLCGGLRLDQGGQGGGTVQAVAGRGDVGHVAVLVHPQAGPAVLRLLPRPVEQFLPVRLLGLLDEVRDGDPLELFHGGLGNDNPPFFPVADLRRVT